MNPKWHIPRRTLLRSAGASIALPLLEAMVVKPGARAAGAPPKRFVGIYGLPTGVVGKRDTVQRCQVAPWTPVESGPIAGLTPDMYLSPFFDAKLEPKITIVTGLSDRMSRSHNCSSVMSPGPAYRQVPYNMGGPTIDQVLGDEMKRQNPGLLASLVLSATENRNGGGVFRNYISWTANAALPVERNPRAVFEKVFGAAATCATVPGATAASAAETARRLKHDLSVLDSVWSDAKNLSNRLGKSDQRRLAEYMDGIRQVETELKAAGAPPPPGCNPGCSPPDPETDEAFYSHANLDVRAGLMMDLIVKAFECDRTRSVSLQLMYAYGFKDYPHLGLLGSHHSISHYGSNSPLPRAESVQWMNKYTVWALSRYAYLMKQLDLRTEGDGSTVLDNSILYMSGEHCNSDGHSLGSMPIILGGRGGRSASGGWEIQAGRHVRYPAWQGGGESVSVSFQQPQGERTIRDLFWGIMKAMGVPGSFGGTYATAPLDFSWADAAAS